VDRRSHDVPLVRGGPRRRRSALPRQRLHGGRRALLPRQLAGESEILRPDLVIAVGTLAIEQVLGEKAPLAEVVGTTRRARWLGRDLEVIALPHPSGASTWHKMEPGKALLGKALRRLAKHPVMKEACS
jgi:uracil-DNA glycosylase